MSHSCSSSRVYKPLPFAIAVLALICLLIPGVLLAQVGTGRVIGTITDESGAAIAGAKVTVTNAATNIHWETTSDSDGSYQVLDLPIGKYSVTAEHEGFAKAVTPVQELEINQSLRIEVRLRVGTVAEVVTVEEIAAQVETVSPTVGGTVTGAPIEALPLNGRNILDLALTQPGVTPSPGTVLPAVAGVPSGDFNIAGGRDNAITYLLDGGDNTSVTYGVPVMNPNPDAVAEFRILTNNYTAEYGRSAGGVVTVVTKSGTNDWHGSVYDYLRNDALDANNFFNKSNPENPQPRPVLKRNQFGATFGGPVFRDKLFFFLAYQGQRQNSVTVGSQLAVYTPQELQQGNFSDSPYASSIAAFLQANPYFQEDAGLAAQGIIDPTKFDPVAQEYIKNNLLPISPNGVLAPNGPASDDRDEYLAKVDYNPTTKDKFTITLSKFHNPQSYSILSGGLAPNVPGFPGNSTFDNYFGTVGYTRTIGTVLLNDFHFTAQRDNNQLNNPAASQPGPVDLKVAITPDQTTGPPQLLFNFSGPQIGFNLNGPARYADTTYLFADTLTWMHGHHTWKFGGYLGITQNNAYFAYAVDGQFYFYGSNTGSDLADFLIGSPEYFDQYPKGYSAVRSHQYAGYAQDEWKVTRRLLLTLGVRYEYNTPNSDPENRNYMVVPGEQSVRFPNAPLGLVFPGDPGAPSHGVNFPDRNNWAPRLGFAWDPMGDGKTSVRGGFGMFYDVVLAQYNQYQNGTPPFYSAASFPLPPSNNGPNTSLSDPYGTVGVINPFPSTPPSSNLDFAAAGFLPFGISSVFINPHLRTPYIYQYNMSVQRQLAPSLAMEIGYVGSSSHKLVAFYDGDPFIIGTTDRPLNEQPGLQIPGAFTAMPSTFANVSGANYNGLVTSLTKRNGDWHNLGNTFFTVAYTYSHSIDNAAGFARNAAAVPAYDHGLFRASSDWDIRHRFVLSGGWELPFAHMWANGPKRLTGGWSLFPILIAQSGLPYDVNAGLFVDGVSPGPSGAGDQNLVRPDWYGGPIHYLDPHQPGNLFFDPSGLSAPACYLLPGPPGTAAGCPTSTYGSLPRNFFRGPGRVNLDLSLEKKTALTERVDLAFRIEFFNILNHTEWETPSVSTPFGSPQLGQITQTYDPRIGQLALRLTF